MSIVALKNWPSRAKEKQKVYKQYLQKVDKNKVLSRLQSFHDDVFSKINCLSCGNCCKHHSPRFKVPDIKRIARYLKIKESAFINMYLYLDEEGDYVLRQPPCPFLGKDNICSIYDVRPSDCSRYPYTDEDVLLKRIALTLKNTTVCPAVYLVLERIMEEIS